MSLLDLKRVSQFALDHELICSAIYQIPDFLAILSTFCGDISVTVTYFRHVFSLAFFVVEGRSEPYPEASVMLRVNRRHVIVSDKLSLEELCEYSVKVLMIMLITQSVVARRV